MLCFAWNLPRRHLQHVLHPVPVTLARTVPEPSAECPLNVLLICSEAPFNTEKFFYRALSILSLSGPFVMVPDRVRFHPTDNPKLMIALLIYIFFFTL